jgi:hypothetical protein
MTFRGRTGTVFFLAFSGGRRSGSAVVAEPALFFFFFFSPPFSGGLPRVINRVHYAPGTH